MKKILAIVGVVIVAFVGFLYYLGSTGPTVDDMTSKTVETMNLYASTLLKNDDIESRAEEVTFEEFEAYLEDGLVRWAEVDRLSAELEEIAAEIEGQQESESLSLIPTAHAYYDKQDISRIFDNAPKGKGIRTLAKELNVSAKKAFQILKLSQEQLKAEAWNTAADKIETIENATKAVKNGCKVGLYVGGQILTGGAAGVIGQAGAIVGGADLVLEIGQDSADAYYGYNNKATAVFSDLRKITEPAANILSFANLDLSDKFDVVMFTADQINSTLQNNTFLGIDIDAAGRYVELGYVPKDKMSDWMKEKGIDEAEDTMRIKEIIEATPVPVTPKKEDKPKEDKPADDGQQPTEVLGDTAADAPSGPGAPTSLKGTVWSVASNEDPRFTRNTIEFGDGTAQSYLTLQDGSHTPKTPTTYTYSDGKGVYGVYVEAFDYDPPTFEVKGDILYLRSVQGGSVTVYEYKRVK